MSHFVCMSQYHKEKWAVISEEKSLIKEEVLLTSGESLEKYHDKELNYSLVFVSCNDSVYSALEFLGDPTVDEIKEAMEQTLEGSI